MFVYSLQDQVVWVQPLAGDILLYSLARLLTLSVSLHPAVLMGTGKFNAGVRGGGGVTL